ncbi:MAG: hypothetical protein LBW85_03995 [Deltaproteobacteria bacterium]|jgi:hypothetical protein|nr:hypothetical protein [Deltaproteobacteria bacterium]
MPISTDPATIIDKAEEAARAQADYVEALDGSINGLADALGAGFLFWEDYEELATVKKPKKSRTPGWGRSCLTHFPMYISGYHFSNYMNKFKEGKASPGDYVLSLYFALNKDCWNATETWSKEEGERLMSAPSPGPRAAFYLYKAVRDDESSLHDLWDGVEWISEDDFGRGWVATETDSLQGLAEDFDLAGFLKDPAPLAGRIKELLSS